MTAWMAGRSAPDEVQAAGARLGACVCSPFSIANNSFGKENVTVVIRRSEVNRGASSNDCERRRRAIRVAGQSYAAVGSELAAQDGFGRGVGAAHHRLPDLWRAQCGEIECPPDLPCLDRRSACRQPASRHGPAGLVGHHGWSRPPVRHESILRHLSERPRRLHGLHGSHVHQSGDRRALRARLSDRHDRRHGARPGAADRPPRHRHVVLRRRRLDGRHAGSPVGRKLFRSRLRRPARSPPRRATPRRTSPSTRSADRR